MKRFGFFIMMYLLASFGAGAVEVEIDGINYDVNTEERTATVIQKDPRYEGNVIIPSSIMVEGTEYSVTRIENFAFERCIGLTSVTIPSSINSFGLGAFMYCSGLTSLTLSEGLTNIGEDTFRCCTGLTSVTIPSSVTTLESCVFADCSALTSVTIPDGVISIGGGAFAGCPALTSVTIPSSVTRIDGGAFHNCTGLTSVHITDLTAWCNIIFEEAYSNPLYYAHRLFLNEEEISELVVPSGVSKIGTYSFLGCMNLTSVLIPSSVNSIGNFAILFCLELADIYCYAEAVPTTGGGTFDDEAFENATLHVPASALEAYKATEPWSKFEKIVALDNQPTDYHPFIEEGKVWIVGDGMWLDTPSAIITYYFGGDTIVGGHQCKKWMCDDSLMPYDSRLGKNLKNAFVASIYEEGKQVYYIREGDETPRLLYDFRGTEETFEVSFFPYPYSELKDSLISCTLTNPGYNDDFHLRYFLIHDNIDHHPNIWYEGIGSTYSPEVNLQILRDEDHRLLQVNVGSEVIYKHRLADEILDALTPTTYRPIIEEGKVWLTSIPDKDFHLRSYTIANDTIIGMHQCKKLMCKEWFCFDDPASAEASYVGALYEENSQTYFFKPGSKTGCLLYDFNPSVDDNILIDDGFGNQVYYTVVQKAYSETERFKGQCIKLQASGPLELINTWMEGVGNSSSPLNNIIGEYPTGTLNEVLISCTVNDEVLYYDEDLSIIFYDTGSPSHVKKNWLDFTHTVKTKPKAPRRGEAAASDEETVTGEYSVKELFVNFKTLTGPYTITVLDAAGQPLYNKVVQTSNVVALNTDISIYPKGSYTITIENENEVYSAEFNIKDEDGLSHTLSPVKQGSIYNLKGQRLTKPQRGVNIINGRKVVVK